MVVMPNFQAQAKEQGDWFEDACIRTLQAAGFDVVDQRVRFKDAGVEVDIIVTGKADISFYITCKGSYQGSRPGCERTDTLKKAIAEAYALHECGWGPVLLLTSHLPTTESGIAMLQATSPDVLYEAIEPLSKHGIKRLQWLNQASEDELRSFLTRRMMLFEMRTKEGKNGLT